ncbi:hypothetical protein QKW35_10325 [Pontibacterium granulatum]|uniref:hypothetical protein n=1 Tax=Pontibacterium granulatum TaxID=2036029 RepID=UPI00249AC7DF|nr:hypothetical protein [Pontibacterium granulatum]MDI3324772.1 hypothetical protein [Pontibacterium granulatum]
MNKILIVDDDISRSSKLHQRLLTSFDSMKIDVDIVASYQEARRALKRCYYPVLFLDMALPVYQGEKDILDDAGAKILREISKGRILKKPLRVIGYTALEKDTSAMELEFENLGFKLYHSRSGDFSWLTKAVSQARYSFSSLDSVETQERELAVVTVHGILTFGSWQEDLYCKIDSEYCDKDVSHLSFKYTRFDVFSFLMPILRDAIVSRFRRDLKRWIEQNSSKRIVCFSHSFGTYVLINALESFDEHLLQHIDLVVLSGSVLKQDHDFSQLRNCKGIRIVNDCAVHDKALLASMAFVPGTGMDGKVGFSTLSDDNFVNRFFSGGHSSFFCKDSGFIDEYWMPLLDSDHSLKAVAFDGDYSLLDKALDNFAKLFGVFKAAYAPLILLFICWYVYDWN